MSADKKKTREKFRNDVFSRDHNKCVMCGITGVPMDAHHITPRTEMPNGGYVKENGITLCNRSGGCHELAEQYFSSTLINQNYTPENLYLKIKSSLKEAISASNKLK